MTNLLNHRIYRLVRRGEAGLVCDEEGLALGAVDLASTQADADGGRRCVMRSPDEIGKILRASYGSLRDETVLRLQQGLGRAAALIEAGELGRAGVQAVMLGVPDLTPEAASKLSAIANLEKAGTAWETEPRLPIDNAGGGEWTTDNGAGAPKVVVRPAKNIRAPGRSAGAGRKRRKLKPSASARVRTHTTSDAADGGHLIPISTATTAFDGHGIGGNTILPQGLARPAGAGLLGLGAALLDGWDAERAQKQVADAITHFGLDTRRPADLVAAMAYVWSKSKLPFHTKAPFSGPALEAASEAVMRRAMIRPAAFIAAAGRQDAKSYSQIIAAANGGLADYLAESRARPPGVDASLQTNSAVARKAIGLRLNDESMQAHHLVTAEAWGKYQDIATLAQEDGWNQNAPSNLIALPSSPPHQAEFAAETGVWLPVHWGPHRNYNRKTLAMVAQQRSRYPLDLRPKDAHAILDLVADENRAAILSGIYNPIIKAKS